jgi:hypothetical protein
MDVAIAWRGVVAWIAVGALGCASSVQPGAADAGADDRVTVGVDRTLPADGALPDAPAAGELASLSADAAAEYCAALFRCCDAPSRDRMFMELLNPGVTTEALQARVRTMGAAQCPAVMTELFRDWIFPDWFAAVERGEAVYLPDETARCVQALRSYQCDGEPWTSVGDGSCFQPSFGYAYRRMFRSVATPGHSCRLPRELGPSHYVGTCLATEGYCCVRDTADPTRCLDYTTVTDRSIPLEGTCVGVAPLGAACGGAATIDNATRACASPLRCGRASRRCVEHRDVPLGAGEPCYDSTDLVFLGACTAPLRCDQSIRDGAGPTYRCVLLGQVGQACDEPADCATFQCNDGVCAAHPRYCAGP